MKHLKYHTDGAGLDGWRIVIYLTVELALHHYNDAARLYGFEPIEHLDHYPNKFLTKIGQGLAIYCSDGQWCGLATEEWASKYLSPGALIDASDLRERLRGALGGAALGALSESNRRGLAGYGAAKMLRSRRKEKKS